MSEARPPDRDRTRDPRSNPASDPRPASLVRRLLPGRDVLVAADLAVLAALGVVVAVFARLRWPGQAPFGSDHDEYRMVAESLVALDGPVVAGIEGTKYPLGYPFLLGLADAVGIPMTGFALALNVALLAATVAVVWLTARRLGPLPALAAGGLVATGSALWAGVYTVMPDIALVFVIALAIAVAAVTERPRDVAWLTLLAVVAVLLKSVGIVLGIALGLWLLLRPAPLRRWSWAPPTAAGGIVVAQMLATAPYPEHTTGYAATFWLDDPFDASLGRIGVTDLPARVVDGLDVVLRDAGRAIVGAHADPFVAQVALVVLVLAAILAWRRDWVLLGGFVGGYLLALAIWPFQSVRLMLPVVPVAVLGAAGLVAQVDRVTRPAGRAGRLAVAAVVVAALAGTGIWHGQRVASDADREGEQYAALHTTTADVVAWIDANVPDDETIASLDYRELAYRLDRTVLPVSYTSDTEEMWAQTGEVAEWFVAIRRLYLAREQRTAELLRAFPDRFERAYANEHVEIYRIVSPDHARPDGDN